MFQALLKEVVDSIDGGLATLVMDFEGIAVDSYTKPNPPAEFDINTVGVILMLVVILTGLTEARASRGTPR